MDITKFEDLFQDTELRTLLWPERNANENLKQDKLVKNLLACADAKKEYFFTLFFDALNTSVSQDKHKGTCGKLKNEFAKRVAKLDGPVKEIAAKVSDAFKTKKVKKEKDIAKAKEFDAAVSAAVSAGMVKEFNLFPNEWVTLQQVRAKGEELFADDYRKAKAILLELKVRKKLDPELQEVEDTEGKQASNQVAKKAPFQLNHSARHFKTDVELSANDVCLGKNRHYLLSQCPKSQISAALLLDVALRQNVSLFIALIEADETKNRCYFWADKNAEKLTLRDGWKITELDKKVIAQDVKEKAGTRDPQLIETTLLATKENETRTLTHIHYDAWRDRNAAPSVELLHKLIDRIEEHQISGTPFQVNCKAGIGRTGTLVMLHLIRQKIYEELANGQALDGIRINIPELLYAARKQRKQLVSEKEQLVQLYQATATFYERLKAQREAIMAATGMQNLDTGSGKLMDLLMSYGHAQIAQ